MKTNYLDSLNKEQKEAATIIDGYELILAGAGTGKTHTLISRVAYLIQHDIKPSSILLLTFTNKAANEMKKRLIEYVGEIGGEITAKTFHSFALECLRNYQRMYNYEPYRPLDSSEDETLIRHARKAFIEMSNMDKNAQKEFPSVKTIGLIISHAINNNVPIDVALYNIDDNDILNYAKEIQTVIEYYTDMKIKNNYINFDDMIKKFYDILKMSPDYRNMIHYQYKYVMCDEYQDTNHLQELLLEEIVGDNGNLCVVGDDNQSIYKFRDADIDNILSFEYRFNDCKVVPLVENYRSSQEILDVSNEMMKNTDEGIAKELKGQFHGDKPKILYTDNDKIAAKIIVDEIEKNFKDGISLSKNAILTRKSILTNYIEQECLQRKIPFKKYGGLQFIDLKNVKMCLNFLRICANDKDVLAWRAILQEFPGVGAKSIDVAIDSITTNGIQAILSPKTFIPKSTTSFRLAVADFSNFWSEIVKYNLVSDKIKTIGVYYSQLLLRQINKTKSDSECDKLNKRLNDLKIEIALLNDMAGMHRSIDTFLDDLTLDNISNDEKSNDFLTISTIHSAKGLEWDNVYIFAPVENVFKTKDYDLLNEERRILYVALTRAKNQLKLVVPKQMLLYGSYEQTLLTSFLNQPNIKKTFDEIVV